MTLDQAKASAQRFATSSGKPCGVYNLNRVGAPQYVVRFVGESKLDIVFGPVEPESVDS